MRTIIRKIEDRCQLVAHEDLNSPHHHGPHLHRNRKFIRTVNNKVMPCFVGGSEVRSSFVNDTGLVKELIKRLLPGIWKRR